MAKEHLIFEDEKVKIVMPSDGCVKGHLKMFPKTKETDFTKLDDELVQHLFLVSSLASSAVFEYLGVQGTNIIMHEGPIAEGGRIVFHIVPRTFEDGLDLMWEAKQGDQEKLDKVLEQLKSKAFGIGAEPEPEQAPIEVSDNREEITASDNEDEEDDYKLRHIRRIP